MGYGNNRVKRRKKKDREDGENTDRGMSDRGKTEEKEKRGRK